MGPRGGTTFDGPAVQVECPTCEGTVIVSIKQHDPSKEDERTLKRWTDELRRNKKALMRFRREARDLGVPDAQAHFDAMLKLINQGLEVRHRPLKSLEPWKEKSWVVDMWIDPTVWADSPGNKWTQFGEWNYKPPYSTWGTNGLLKPHMMRMKPRSGEAVAKWLSEQAECWHHDCDKRGLPWMSYRFRMRNVVTGKIVLWLDIRATLLMVGGFQAPTPCLNVEFERTKFCRWLAFNPDTRPLWEQIIRPMVTP